MVFNTSRKYMQITLLPAAGLFVTARQFFADAIFPEGKELRDTAERNANVDPLTGLANRRAFDLARDTAEADPDTVFIIFDANNFGQVNKQLGHAAGDDVLKDMARVLQLAASRFQVGTRTFRLGGDEFIIICPADRADKVRDLVEIMYTPFKLNDGSIVSLSGTTGDTLVDADTRLQDRKADRKNAILL